MRANFEVGGRGCENDDGARMLTNELKDMILKMGVFRSLHGTFRRPSSLKKETQTPGLLLLFLVDRLGFTRPTSSNRENENPKIEILVKSIHIKKTQKKCPKGKNVGTLPCLLEV